MRRGIAETVRGFLRNTQRVVSVVIYAVVLVELKGRQMMLMRHRFQEFDNPGHRFDRSKGWLLFRDYQVPKEWGGMPPKWHRIFSQGFLFGEKAGVNPALGAFRRFRLLLIMISRRREDDYHALVVTKRGTNRNAAALI